MTSRTSSPRAPTTLTTQEWRTNAWRPGIISRDRLGGPRDRGAQEAEIRRHHRVHADAAPRVRACDEASAEQSADLHARVWLGGRDVRLLDTGVDLGLLAPRRRRK